MDNVEIGEDVEQLVVDAVAQNYVVSATQFDDLDDVSISADDRRSKQSTHPLIPPQVLTFLHNLHRLTTAQHASSLSELHQLYEVAFNKLTEKFYPKSPWPTPETVQTAVGDEPIFVILYSELYYRHFYSRCNPGLKERDGSYYNYVKLFNFLLSPENPVELELPNIWLWDIIDEMIYQFQSWCTYRTRNLRNKSAEDIDELRNSNIWDVYNVLNILYQLISKSKIQEQLVAQRNGEDPTSVADAFGTHPLYKMLGYFSIIGLLRVHCLLGDYVLALKMMDNIELSKKAMFARVTACHVTTYYYVGFAYMMMRRYSDAIKAFTHILVFISRTKQYHTRSYQYDQIMKKSEQMYSLLAICVSLCPTRLDEQIHTALRERHADSLSKLQSADEAEALATCKDLFLYSCPKFISPNPPDYDVLLAAEDENVKLPEPHVYQCSIFLRDVKNQLKVPHLRSFLKLYSTLGVSKLAGVMGVDEDSLRRDLLVFKNRTHGLKWTQGSLLSGEVITSTDLDFYISNDILHIAESKIGRKYADWFIRNINKFEDLIINMKK
ncbi:RNA polymerase I-associated factor PAF67-domain-containing protein [Paraphysoderma sedebokerense]|nr:RNA polymerase I-associated factor PAF67-domain-containing protein [Paraphysoderma sedebokerense]